MTTTASQPEDEPQGRLDSVDGGGGKAADPRSEECHGHGRRLVALDPAVAWQAGFASAERDEERRSKRRGSGRARHRSDDDGARPGEPIRLNDHRGVWAANEVAPGVAEVDKMDVATTGTPGRRLPDPYHSSFDQRRAV